MATKKPKGWVKEPVRHGLAARGVKTAQRHLKHIPSSYSKQQVEQALDRVMDALTATGMADPTHGPGMKAQGLLRAGWSDELGTIERKVSWQSKPLKVQRSTSFLTEPLTQAQASVALSHPDIHDYNDMNVRAVAATLDRLQLDLGDVYLGREGSPVIYFDGATPGAVNAFMKNLQKRDKYSLPQEFAGPSDTGPKKRDPRGSETTARSSLSEHGHPKTHMVYRLWWD